MEIPMTFNDQRTADQAASYLQQEGHTNGITEEGTKVIAQWQKEGDVGQFLTTLVTEHLRQGQGERGPLPR